MEDRALEYCILPLTKGQFAKVSPSRYLELSRWKWRASWSRLGNCYYAVRSVKTPKLGVLYMHRVILGLTERFVYADHINGDTLDNRDENLRPVTPSQNRQNSSKKKRGGSGFKGVSFHRGTGKWRSEIRINGASIHLGLFTSPEEGHQVYCEAAKRLFGEFWRPD